VYLLYDNPEVAAKGLKVIPESIKHLVHWVLVKFEFPEGLDPNPATLNPVWVHRYPYYHNMIRFWVYRLWHWELLRKLDYYLRFDADSWVPTPIKYDIFKYFAKKGWSYGYRRIFQDVAYVSLGLLDWVDDYSKKYPVPYQKTNDYFIPPDGRNEDSNPKWAYQNNFEIVRVKSFLRCEVLHFIDLVDRSHSIYKYRWGDAPLRYSQTHYFLNVSRDVHWFCDFHYHHGADMVPECDIPEDALEFAPKQ